MDTPQKKAWDSEKSCQGTGYCKPNVLKEQTIAREVSLTSGQCERWRTKTNHLGKSVFLIGIKIKRQPFLTTILSIRLPKFTSLGPERPFWRQPQNGFGFSNDLYYRFTIYSFFYIPSSHVLIFGTKWWTEDALAGWRLPALAGRCHCFRDCDWPHLVMPNDQHWQWNSCT